MSYLRPTDLDEAVDVLGRGDRRVLAGATDYYPAQVGRPLLDDIVDITGVAELRGISRDDAGRFRIGALTTWAEIAAADLPSGFDGLRAAAREVGSVQIQNVATIGGNLCNASPAADGVPPLLTLDASIELRSSSGSRELPIESFLTGYRSTALRPGELLTAVLVPSDVVAARSSFVKLGSRTYLVISIVMVAAAVVLDHDGRVDAARVAVGACSPVAVRLRELERALVGRSSAELADAVDAARLGSLSPIDDVRASAAYRHEAAAVLVRRALTECGTRP